MATNTAYEKAESVKALLQDIDRILMRIAHAGHCSPERKNDIEAKLHWALSELRRMPTEEAPNDT